MDKTLKQIIPMECPVCKKFYFTELTEDDMQVLHLTPNTTQCDMCGWYYDLEQVNDPELENQSNEMSLNQYRQWYEKKIKDNPDWEYYQDFIGDPEPHECPVCGEYEFEDVCSYDICPVCGWEDTGFEDEPDEKPSPYMMSCNERVEWFKQKRKENPKYKWSKDKNR